MASIILICGNLCTGKSTYANALAQELPAVVLSSDALISALYHPRENEVHNQIIGPVHQYLFELSLSLLRADCNVILDWGFWTKADRDRATKFFQAAGYEPQWHHLHIAEEEWQRRIEARNRAVARGETMDYAVDEGLFQKATSLFEPPIGEDMVDVCPESSSHH